MDIAVIVGVIINAALLLITAGAAVAAIVQARTAVAARTDAEEARDEAQQVAKEATDAFKRQAAALERSNELKEAERRPPAWSGPTFVSGQMYSMTNNSGRTISVHHFETEPDGTENFIRIEAAPDGI